MSKFVAMESGILEVRSVQSMDLPDVVRIEQESFQNPWSSTLLTDIVDSYSSESAVFNVMVHDGEVIGYSIAQMTRTEAHIVNLAVCSNYRRRGFGRRLTDCLVQWAKCKMAEEIWLEVRESNSAAIKLYDALGFIIGERRRRYYSNPIEDALVMVKRLTECRGLQN